MALAACGAPAPPCDVPSATLGTVPFADGAQTDRWAPLVDGGDLALEAGGQGGVHVWASVRLTCPPSSPAGAFWLEDASGAVVAGAPGVSVPLDVIMTCVEDDAATTCTGQQVVFVVDNPAPDDPAWFGPPFTLRFVGDAEDARVVTLVDAR